MPHKRFPYYWPFVRGFHQLLVVVSLTKGQDCRHFMISMLSASKSLNQTIKLLVGCHNSHKMPPFWICERGWSPGGWINIKMPSYQSRKYHCGDKTILRPSYLHNGISYTGKTTSLYWIGALWCIYPNKHAIIYQHYMGSGPVPACLQHLYLWWVKSTLFYIKTIRLKLLQTPMFIDQSDNHHPLIFIKSDLLFSWTDWFITYITCLRDV